MSNRKLNTIREEDDPEQLQEAQQNENELEQLGEELRAVWGEMETLMSTMNPFNSPPALPTPTLVSSSASSPAPDNEPLEELALARQAKILQQTPMKTNGTNAKYRTSNIRRTQPDGRPMFRGELDFWSKPKLLSRRLAKRELKERIKREKDALIREMHSRVLKVEEELVVLEVITMSCNTENSQLEKNLANLRVDYNYLDAQLFFAIVTYAVLILFIVMKIVFYLYLFSLPDPLYLPLETPDTPEPHDPRDTLEPYDPQDTLDF